MEFLMHLSSAKRHKLALLVLFCLPLVPVAANAQSTEPLAQGENFVITQADVDVALAALGERAASVATEPELRRQLVDNLVSRRLLERAALAAKVDQDPEVARRLEFLKTDLIIQRFVERETANLDEAALRAHFDEFRDRFSRKEVRISRLYTRDASKAVAWRKKLVASPRKLVDLAALATSESEDANSGKAKGDLGFMRRGALEDALDRFAFGAAKGDLSEVIRLKDGYVVAIVTDIKVGKPVSFEEVRADVARLARADVERRLIISLRTKANVKLDDNRIRHGGSDAAKIP
jgi:parvulin-like peptidyl-prolyl isomerase